MQVNNKYNSKIRSFDDNHSENMKLNSLSHWKPFQLKPFQLCCIARASLALHLFIMIDFSLQNSLRDFEW